MTKSFQKYSYHFKMTLKTLNFLYKVSEACFNVSSVKRKWKLVAGNIGELKGSMYSQGLYCDCE